MTQNRTFSSEYLASLLEPDFENGRLFWKVRRSRHAYPGAEAGGEHVQPRRGSNGETRYWELRIDGKTFRRGHILFCLANGYFAAPFLDHINGNSLDDRLINLRPATRAQNAQNIRRRIPMSLPMGVRLNKKCKSRPRYWATITPNGTREYLGSFDSPEEASAVYQAARKKYYGEFA